MKRLVFPILACAAVTALLSLVGCDEEKKKAEILEKTASTDAGLMGMVDAALPIPPSPPESASAATAAAPKICPSGPDLVVDDKDLEAELRRKLAKPKDPLKVSDLSNIKSLNLTQKASLDAIDPCVVPKLKNLKDLFLGPGKYRDLSPIANLTQLWSLRASISEVEDLKPLEKLVMMDRLDLGRTHVRDISVLANLVNLTELQLDDTQVVDLAPLAKDTKLEKVSIKRTNVTDVSPLKGLTALKFLYVEGCAIANLDALAPLTAHGLKVVTQGSK